MSRSPHFCLAVLALALGAPLCACVADLDDLSSRGRDAGPAVSGLDALPRDAAPSDAGPRADATARDGAAHPDAEAPCPSAGAPPITLAINARTLDLSPTGDRLLVGDGAELNLYALPEGRHLFAFRGLYGYFTHDARAIVFDLGGGELRTIDLYDRVGRVERISLDPACFFQITPDRRQVVAVLACQDSAITGGQVGRLEVYTVGPVGPIGPVTTVATQDEVLVDSVVATPRGAASARIGYLQRPAAAACPCATSWAAAVGEIGIDASGDRIAPPAPGFRRLLGYSADGASLLASGPLCACTMEADGAIWDVNRAREVVRAQTPWSWPREPLDGHGAWSFALPHPALGAGGVLAFPFADMRLSYTPYDGSQPAQTLLPRVVPSSSAILRVDGVDTIALTLDDMARLVRLRVTPPVTPPEVLSQGTFGVRDLRISDDGRDLAFVTEFGGQVVVEQLALARVNGPVRVAYSASSNIHSLGFLPNARGFLIEDQGTLRLFRDDLAFELDVATDPGAPVISDARGCWVAHTRAGAVAEVRVVAVP